MTDTSTEAREMARDMLEHYSGQDNQQIAALLVKMADEIECIVAARDALRAMTEREFYKRNPNFSSEDKP